MPPSGWVEVPAQRKTGVSPGGLALGRKRVAIPGRRGMNRFERLLTAGAIIACMSVVPGVASADPGEDHGRDDIPVPTPSLQKADPGIENMELLDVSKKDGTTNSDIAFYGNMAYVGNYDGFRIIDISDPSNLEVRSDLTCRANQGDLSVFRGKNGRRYLLQSIDRPVTAPDCTATDTPLVAEDERGVSRNRARFGYEGLRLFDVTDPESPQYVRFYRTACGSHTHTLVPDPAHNRVNAYVASYPLGAGITPEVDQEESDRRNLTCEAPHRKISVVSLPLSDPEAGRVRTRALSEDTEYYDPDGPYSPTGGGQNGTQPQGTAEPIQACHDHQVFMPRKIVVGSCAGDAQYWSIAASAGDPTSGDGEAHTHIKRENGTTESFDFIHNATVTWDGKYTTISDESGGGGAPRCDAQQTKRGFTFFYPLVEPGAQVDGFADLKGTYMIPRPQNTEICVSHNGNILPVKDRYLQVQAFYQGGNSFYDFTNLTAPQELAWSDLETRAGSADSWSTYWYNGVVYVNGGLNRRNSGTGASDGNRGFEAYALDDLDGTSQPTKRWSHFNPQTQEASQAP